MYNTSSFDAMTDVLSLDIYNISFFTVFLGILGLHLYRLGERRLDEQKEQLPENHVITYSRTSGWLAECVRTFLIIVLYALSVAIWILVLYYSTHDDTTASILSFLAVASTVLLRKCTFGISNWNNSFAKIIGILTVVLMIAGFYLLLLQAFYTTAFYSICLAFFLQKTKYELHRLIRVNRSHFALSQAVPTENSFDSEPKNGETIETIAQDSKFIQQGISESSSTEVSDNAVKQTDIEIETFLLDINKTVARELENRNASHTSFAEFNNCKENKIQDRSFNWCKILNAPDVSESMKDEEILGNRIQQQGNNVKDVDAREIMYTSLELCKSKSRTNIFEENMLLLKSVSSKTVPLEPRNNVGLNLKSLASNTNALPDLVLKANNEIRLNLNETMELCSKANQEGVQSNINESTGLVSKKQIISDLSEMDEQSSSGSKTYKSEISTSAEENLEFFNFTTISDVEDAVNKIDSSFIYAVASHFL